VNAQLTAQASSAPIRPPMIMLIFRFVRPIGLQTLDFTLANVKRLARTSLWSV
jgi:hypothetical protein